MELKWPLEIPAIAPYKSYSTDILIAFFLKKIHIDARNFKNMKMFKK